MNLYVVEYAVPVLCFVDLEDGTVFKVHVDDEAIAATGDVYDSVECMTTLEANDPVRAKAIAVAEEKSWPSWHFGF